MEGNIRKTILRCSINVCKLFFARSEKRSVNIITYILLVAISAAITYNLKTHFLKQGPEPFTFSNKMFSHLKPVPIDIEPINHEILSSISGVIGYLRIRLLGSFDEDPVSYMINVAAEAFLMTNLIKLVDDKNIQNTCKSYIKFNVGYDRCIIDFQKDIYSKYQLSSTGIILLFSIVAQGTINIKKHMTKKYGEKDIYVKMKLKNVMIENFILSAEKLKEIILVKDKALYFSMGYKLKPNSIIVLIERQIIYKFLLKYLETIDDYLLTNDKNLVKIEIERKKSQKGSLSSVQFIEFEKTRLRALKDRHASFQTNGFNIDAIKLKQKETDKQLKELEVKLNQREQLKEDGLLSKISDFFNPSLDEITLDDLMKKKEEPSESKSYPKYNTESI